MKKIGIKDNLIDVSIEGDLIEIERDGVTDETLMGFVVGAVEDFLLLQQVNDDFLLNGYSALRLKDVSKVNVVVDRKSLITYTLKQRYPQGYIRANPFKSSRLKKLIFSRGIHDYFPIVTVHTEMIDDSVVWIGRVVSSSESSVEIKSINSDGSWDNTHLEFYLDDITRIDFGGLYEEALWIYSKYRFPDSVF